MKNILLVLCGGTICTAVTATQDGVFRSISDDAVTWLSANYFNSDSLFTNDVKFHTSENFKILSENMTVDKWNSLIRYFSGKRKSFKDYDGIIVAHGTDTLAYSSALFSLLLRNIGIPVFFVSSNEPLNLPNGDINPCANGNINFQKAVECICMGIKPNVYVVYKNPSSGRVFLHLGSRITQCRNYSEDFYSEGSIDITSLSGAEMCAELFRDISINDSEVIAIDNSPVLHNCVLKIDPYVGLDYHSFDYSRFKAVLHGAYHSGTVCAEKTKEAPGYGTQSILHLIDACCGKVDIYISPAKNTGEIYDSVGIVANHRCGEVHFLYGCTNEMTYVKLLLAYSLGVVDIDAFMETEFNSEKLYS